MEWGGWVRCGVEWGGVGWSNLLVARLQFNFSLKSTAPRDLFLWTWHYHKRAGAPEVRDHCTTYDIKYLTTDLTREENNNYQRLRQKSLIKDRIRERDICIKEQKFNSRLHVSMTVNTTQRPSMLVRDVWAHPPSGRHRNWFDPASIG